MEQIPFEDEKPSIHIHPVAAPVADAAAGHDDVTDIHDGHPVHATVDEHAPSSNKHPNEDGETKNEMPSSKTNFLEDGKLRDGESVIKRYYM